MGFDTFDSQSISQTQHIAITQRKRGSPIDWKMRGRGGQMVERTWTITKAKSTQQHNGSVVLSEIQLMG